MTKFSTMYDKRDRYFTNVGTEFHTLYRRRIDDDGTLSLEIAGKEHIPTFLKKSMDSCDIHSIIARYQAGDMTLLSVRPDSAYFDATSLPNSMRDVLDVVRSCEDVFDRLPLEERAKYGYDVNRFISDYGSDNFIAALGVDRNSSSVDSGVSSSSETAVKEVKVDE